MDSSGQDGLHDARTRVAPAKQHAVVDRVFDVRDVTAGHDDATGQPANQQAVLVVVHAIERSVDQFEVVEMQKGMVTELIANALSAAVDKAYERRLRYADSIKGVDVFHHAEAARIRIGLGRHDQREDAGHGGRTIDDWGVSVHIDVRRSDR